jgi:hypothetical protein
LNRLSQLLLLLCTATLYSGCEYFRQKKIPEKASPLARAGSEFLYLEDLTNLVPKNISTEDSAKLAEKFIDDWIKKQLMVIKAREELTLDEAEIERKVLDYRYALIVHEFEKLYIDAHLDVTVDPLEIEAFYSERQDNFVLKQNIIRCIFVQIPKSAPGISEIRRNVRSYPNANIEDISNYSLQYAMKSFLDDSLWINFDEVVTGTPLAVLENKIRFLQNTTFSETSDDNFVYLLKIFDYKISDQISPLAYIREDIENIIISKRKLNLKKELEQAIYNEALRENRFETYP